MLPQLTQQMAWDVSMSCEPASGSAFALGANTVNCSAVNAAGDVVVTITVHDTIPPVLGSIPASATIEATSS